MVPGTSAVSQSLPTISPASLSLSSALSSKEDKQTLGVSLRRFEEQTGQLKFYPGEPQSNSLSQDPRLPTKRTGNPANTGDSQEPEGDRMYFLSKYSRLRSSLYTRADFEHHRSLALGSK